MYKWHISIVKVRKNNITVLLLRITLIIASNIKNQIICKQNKGIHRKLILDSMHTPKVMAFTCPI